MAKIKKLLALILSICVICTVSVMSVSAANTDDDNDTSASSTITVHYYCEEGTPTIYYWNSLPKNISTEYPGVKMTSEGNNYYKYTFNDVTKINMMFVTNGKQSAELTRNTGEWWYKNKRWSSKNPEDMQEFDRVDMREDTIYFVITTRFYDGDTGNDVHCWDDSQANNPDSDPAWRGDFKGLIDKLDYIKALGFSAIWITPVVTNASGYDYHGYHAMDFSTVDVRYESDGATYQDLIDAAHEKGIKIVQDIVVNHSGNFGEATLAPMFTKEYDSIQDLASVDCMKVIEGSDFAKTFPNYDDLEPKYQYAARLNIMKDTRSLTPVITTRKTTITTSKTSAGKARLYRQVRLPVTALISTQRILQLLITLTTFITTISTWVLTLSDLILKSTFQDLHLTSITSRHGSRQAVKTSSSLVRFVLV